MTILKLKSPYVLLILLLIFSFLAFSLWSAFQASKRGSQISDPNYYSKGLKYNNTRIEERAAVSRGWRLETQINGLQLHFELFDRTNLPISQASGELTVYLANQQKIILLHTNETGAGVYSIDLPTEISGSLQARIDFLAQGARISRQLLVNL